MPFLARSFHRVTFSGLVLNFLAIPLTGLLMALGFVFLGAALVSPFAARLMVPSAGLFVRAFLWTTGLADPLPFLSYRIPDAPSPHGHRLFRFSAAHPAPAPVQGAEAGQPGRFCRLRRGPGHLSLSAALLAGPRDHLPRCRAGGFDPGRVSRTEKDAHRRGRGGGRQPGHRRARRLPLSLGPGREKARCPRPHPRPPRPSQRLEIGRAQFPDRRILGGGPAARRKPGLRGIDADSRAVRRTGTPWAAGSAAGREKFWSRRSIRSPERQASRISPTINRSSSRSPWARNPSCFPAISASGAEAELIEGEADMRARVLKSPHHGSRTSSSPAFLDAVRPEFVVVTAGRGNFYGLPHPDIIARYIERGARVLRTDEEGAVRFATDGSTLRVSTSAGGRAPSREPNRERPAATGEPAGTRPGA